MRLKECIRGICQKNNVIWEIYVGISRKKIQFREWRLEILPIYKARISNPGAVFLVYTPEHGNLGDHAIAVAEKRLLDKIDISYIEITGKKLEMLFRNKKLDVMNGRPILINGGGNLGTLWFGCEQVMREIYKKNKRSKILCLPNTIFYEKSKWGQQELEKSIQIYGAHPCLKLYAREKISYEIMSKVYKNVKLVPDMVLSLNESKLHEERKGCLLCLRSDIERTYTDEDRETIYREASRLFGENVCYTDMVIDHGVSPSEREEALESKYDQFRRAELVITDRLHGMIFCAITGTPCIVVNSKSHKIKGCYEWIKHLEYIRFCDRIDKIADEYAAIPQKSYVYDNSHIAHYYDELKADILQALQ